MTTRVDMGQYTLVVDCLKPYTGGERLAAPVWGWGDALSIFNAEADRMHTHRQAFTSEGIGLAKQMAKRYNREQLTKMVYKFWQLHSDELDENINMPPLRLFWAKRAILERGV